METLWAAMREPVEPIGVTELLETRWGLAGPEQALESGLVKAFPSGPIDVDRLDSAGWVGLGLSPRQAASAMRYRQAVGGFRNAEVLGRLRVLPDGWMERHGDRLVVPVDLTTREDKGQKAKAVKPDSSLPEPRRAGASQAGQESPVDLNVADSLTLIGLPGVGPWVSGRILAARRRWGGFADTSLLVEALGWDSLARAIMPRFTCSPGAVHRRCPDSLSVEEWEALPGIGRREAATLARFVGHHGGSRETLRSCRILDSTRWNRVLPYLGCGGEEHP